MVMESNGLDGWEDMWNAVDINDVPRYGTTPNNTQTAARIDIPKIMLRETSLMLIAYLLLALERNVMPNSLTNVAAAIPIVSAKGRLAKAIEI